jgi:hypothetical protein
MEQSLQRMNKGLDLREGTIDFEIEPGIPGNGVIRMARVEIKKGTPWFAHQVPLALREDSNLNEEKRILPLPTRIRSIRPPQGIQGLKMQKETDVEPSGIVVKILQEGW